VRIGQLEAHWKDFCEISCGGFVLKSVGKIQVCLKSYQMETLFANIYVHFSLRQLRALPSLPLHQVIIISVTDIVILPDLAWLPT
jgi:hypothetical protein